MGGWEKAEGRKIGESRCENGFQQGGEEEKQAKMVVAAKDVNQPKKSAKNKHYKININSR